MKIPAAIRRPRMAFTLVEALVAISVFVLMMSLLSQMMGHATNATHRTYQEVDSARGVRASLDFLRADIENMINVNGLTLLVRQDGANNTQLVFLTQGRGPAAGEGGRCIAVAYTLLPTGELDHRVASVSWSQIDLVTGALSALSAPTASTLVTGCLRFEAMAVLDNGIAVPLTQAGGWRVATLNGTALPSGFYGLVLSSGPVNAANPRVRSLLVGTAALDPQSYKLPRASLIAGQLASPASSGDLVETWNQNRKTVQAAGYPKPAVAALSFAEQVYPLK